MSADCRVTIRSILPSTTGAGFPNAIAAIAAEVDPYLTCAPKAVGAAKRLARALGPTIDAATIEMSVNALIAQWEGDEAREGIAAFFDKRTPPWG